MNNDIIEKIFETPSYRLKVNGNINPGVDYKFHTTYGSPCKTVTHSHEFYEVFLTIKGNVIHCINKTVQILEPGCLVFIRPDDEHGYMYNEGEDYEFVNLAMSCELLGDLLEFLKPAFDCSDMLKSAFPPVSRLTKSETQSLLKKMNSLNLIPSRDISGQKLQVRLLVMEMFIQYFIGKPQIKNADIPIWLEETCRLMKKTENFTAGQKRMCEISRKTPEHLSRTMKKYLGVTPTGFINDLRINYAANLLANTNLKIADICYESGFGNISHFYTVFNSIYGKSPKEYRRSTVPIR